MKIKENFRRDIFINGDMRDEVLSLISTLFPDGEDIRDMGNKSESSKTISPTSKAIGDGSIYGVIAAALAIGGCFAAGASLPILA